MRRFFGKIGYETAVDKGDGIWEQELVARSYYGDVIRNATLIGNGEKVNDDLSVGNSISVVADAYAIHHFSTIRYVEWAGVAWKVEKVTLAHPRLILELGGVYNGQKAPVPGGP
jgi:hypothetical protein